MTLPALEKILNSIFEALEKEVSEFQNSPDDWGIYRRECSHLYYHGSWQSIWVVIWNR
jgi:hypothetical protein